jgi:hypothetical protein
MRSADSELTVEDIWRHFCVPQPSSIRQKSSAYFPLEWQLKLVEGTGRERVAAPHRGNVER